MPPPPRSVGKIEVGGGSTNPHRDRHNSAGTTLPLN